MATGAKLVEPADATLEQLDFIDTTRAYFRVTAEGGDPLPGEIASAVSVGQIALAAECVGVAQRALDMSVEYAKERRAVRPRDRLLPGRLTPPRGHALGGRGGPLAHLLRGVGRRCRSGPAADRRFDG